ncbi:MAG: hypothetical protein R3A47_03065 [Polyangiales bacterium]
MNVNVFDDDGQGLVRSDAPPSPVPPPPVREAKRALRDSIRAMQAVSGKRAIRDEHRGVSRSPLSRTFSKS